MKIKNLLIYILVFSSAYFILWPIFDFVVSKITSSSFTFSFTSHLSRSLFYGSLLGLVNYLFDMKKKK